MLIAITGPFGFVGTQLTKHLTPMHELRLLSRSNNSHPSSAQINYDDSSNLINSTKDCQCIIHLGGMAHLPQNTPEAQAQINKANVTDTLSLAKAASQNNCSHFIYISSIKVNGEETFEHPFTYNSPASPEDHYGRSKLTAERSLQELCKKTDMKLTIIRPGLVYGHNNKGNLAALEKLIKLRVPLPLKNLNNKRSLIHIDTLCSLISTCCDNPKAADQIFLAADKSALSSADIAVKLSQSGNLPKPILFPLPQGLLRIASKYLPPLKKLTGNLEIDTTHTQKTLKWSATSFTPNNK